ncbi:MAG: hypothetical protein ACFFFC_00500 [Candidatus Thorarchaeota archaeon]
MKEAKIWGFGPFKKQFMDNMPYPSNFYKDIQEGSIVNGIFCALSSNASSDLLADLLGINFNSMSWEIESRNIDLSLFSFISSCPDEGDNSVIMTAVVNIQRLMRNGWRFFIDPSW